MKLKRVTEDYLKTIYILSLKGEVHATRLAVLFGRVIAVSRLYQKTRVYIVIQLVLQMGLNANDLKLFSALVVALFLGVPYWKGQLSAKHVKTNKGGKDNA